jgi:hypothetical protein
VADVPPSEVIHSLKNYLAIVVSFSQLVLMDAAEDDPKRRDLEEIVKAAEAAMALMPEVNKCLRP